MNEQPDPVNNLSENPLTPAPLPQKRERGDGMQVDSKPKRRWVKLGLWLLLAGLPIAYVFSAARRPHEFIAEANLPGGMYRLQLLQVTDGKLDYEWSDPLRSLRGFSMLGVRLVPGTSIPPISVHLEGGPTAEGLPGNASFLFRFVDLKGRFANPSGYHQMRIVFRDSNGFVYSDVFEGARHDQWGAFAFTVSAVPRRDRELNFVFATNDFTKITELKIPNPFFVESPPEWTAEPLPSEKKSKHITATLAGLDAYANETALFTRQSTFPRLSYKDDEHPNDPIRHVTTWFEDPCGNRGMSLSPFEKVWRLHVRVHRPAVATFPPEQIVNLGSLTIPEPGKLEVIGRKMSLNGVDFTIACLSGGGSARREAGKWSSAPLNKPMSESGLNLESGYTNGVAYEQISMQRPYLWIEHANLPPEKKLLTRFKMASGWNAAETNATGTIGNVQLAPAVLRSVQAGESVEIEVIVSESEEFEFYVAPPQAE